MSLRRLLPLLIVIALAIAPFGRMGMAEARAMPKDMSSAMAFHCAGQPMPEGDKGGRVGIDCMIACAAMAPAATPPLSPPPPTAAVPIAARTLALDGIHPEADPPPPRFS